MSIGTDSNIRNLVCYNIQSIYRHKYSPPSIFYYIFHIKPRLVQQSSPSAKWTPIPYQILQKLSEYCSIVLFQISHQIKNHQGNVKYCHYLTPAERTNVKLLKIYRIMNAPMGKHLSKKY